MGAPSLADLILRANPSIPKQEQVTLDHFVMVRIHASQPAQNQ